MVQLVFTTTNGTPTGTGVGLRGLRCPICAMRHGLRVGTLLDAACSGFGTVSRWFESVYFGIDFRSHDLLCA